MACEIACAPCPMALVRWTAPKIRLDHRATWPSRESVGAEHRDADAAEHALAPAHELGRDQEDQREAEALVRESAVVDRARDADEEDERHDPQPPVHGTVLVENGSPPAQYRDDGVREHHGRAERAGPVVVVAAADGRTGQVAEVHDHAGQRRRHRGDQDVAVVDVGQLVAEDPAQLALVEHARGCPRCSRPRRCAGCARWRTRWARWSARRRAAASAAGRRWRARGRSGTSPAARPR